MDKNAITVLIGHPDPDPDRLVRKLAQAYASGARAAGRQVQLFDLARMDFPMLRGREDFESEAPAGSIVAQFQAAIGDSAHLAIFHPLWLGGMPALLKALLEQTCRGGFAFDPGRSPFARKLKGRSARIIVTMGMPAWLYRYWYGMPGIRMLERNILGFIGFTPIRRSLIGSVDTLGEAGHARWLSRMSAFGSRDLS